MFLSVKVVKFIANKAQSQILAAVSLYMHPSNQISQDHGILTLEPGGGDQTKDLSMRFFFFIKGDDVYHVHRRPELLIQLLSPMPPNNSTTYTSSFVEEKVKLMVNNNISYG